MEGKERKEREGDAMKERKDRQRNKEERKMGKKRKISKGR